MNTPTLSSVPAPLSSNAAETPRTAKDPLTGPVNNSDARGPLPFGHGQGKHMVVGRGEMGAPLPMHAEARERVRSGKSPSMKHALAAVAAERSQPNVVVAAFARMFNREESLLKQRDEAAAKLREFNQAIAREQNAGVVLLTQRDQLRAAAEKAWAQLNSRVTKATRISSRLQQAESELSRYLSKTEGVEWVHLNTLGAPISALRLAAAEMDRQTAAAKQAMASAEDELAAFVEAHADDLAIVAE